MPRHRVSAWRSLSHGTVGRWRPLSDVAYLAFIKWAGTEAGQADISKERLTEFLNERDKDISPAGRPKWSGWLRGLRDAPSLELRAWALARRLEGGHIFCCAENERIAFGYVRVVAKPE